MNQDDNPFRSPQAAGDPVAIQLPPPGSGRPVIPYASGHTRAVWAIALLATALLLDMIGAASTLLEIGLLEGVRSGGPIDNAVAEANDLRQGLIGLCQAAVFLGSAVAFLMWIHRAHRNLPALGAVGLKYSPGWAVGSFFVPILNLFRPCQIMKEIWAGSDPSAAGLDSLVRRPRVSPLVGWWWAFWLAMNFTGYAAFRMSLGAESLDVLLASSWTALASDLLTVPAALLAILVVRGVDANQQQRHGLLSAPEVVLAGGQ